MAATQVTSQFFCPKFCSLSLQREATALSTQRLDAEDTQVRSPRQSILVAFFSWIVTKKIWHMPNLAFEPPLLIRKLMQFMVTFGMSLKSLKSSGFVPIFCWQISGSQVTNSIKQNAASDSRKMGRLICGLIVRLHILLRTSFEIFQSPILPTRFSILAKIHLQD